MPLSELFTARSGRLLLLGKRPPSDDLILEECWSRRTRFFLREIGLDWPLSEGGQRTRWEGFEAKGCNG